MARKIFITGAGLKNMTLAAGCMVTALTLGSCYSTTVSVGNMSPTDPAVEVNTAHNGHFIGGLVNATKVEDEVYVGEAKDYLMKTQVSVGDVFATLFTAGLFAPTTTKFYLPYGSEMPPRVKMPPVKFGIRAGVNFASIDGDYRAYDMVDDGSYGSTVGYKVGAIVDIPLTPNVYFQPGIYYSQKGAKVVKTKYYEVPLLFSYRAGVNNKLRHLTEASSFTKGVQLQIDFGPYIGGCGSTKFGGIEHFDYGLRAGLGGLFLKHIYIGASYEYGLNSIVDQDWDRGKGHNRTLSVNAGFNL